MVCLGSAGDVWPFIRLGVQLSRRRHKVSVITNRYFQSQVEAACLDFVEMGKADEQEKAMQSPHLYHPRKGVEVFYQCSILPSIHAGYEAILQCYVPGQTVIVASRYSVAARIAQDRLQIPTVSIVLTPYGLCCVQDSARVTSDVNTFRFSLGLPRVKHVLSRWLLSPERVIGFFPRWFAAPRPTWPPQVRLTGFPLDKAVGSKIEPPELESFLSSGERPIIFTPGTAMKHADRFFRESALVCRRAGFRGVFVTPFERQIPSDLPGTIIHVRATPFGQLFPRAKAVVHVGGIGTSAQAMASGVPQLVLPLAFDQFDNAKRLQKLGIALSIGRHAYRSGLVEDRLRRLTSDSRTREQCTALAARFTGRSPIEGACEAIEAYARTRRISL